MKRRQLVLGAAVLAGLSVAVKRTSVRRRPTLPSHVDDGAPLDVLIIGAGLSGIGAARHLLAKNPETRFEILEARGAIGGTWDLFRYPGVRSDSDVYTLGYSFKPWRGQNAIAEGEDIRQYIQEASDEAGITPKIRFHHKVKAAAWSSQEQLWNITAETYDDRGNVQSVTRKARFLFLCSGYYSYDEGHRPDFPNEDAFQGQIVHPQFWPEDLDYTGKRVVVIGSGATAITLIPSLADRAAHVTMLQRSPSHIAVRPLVDETALKLQKLAPPAVAHGLIRWKNVLTSIFYYQIARRKPDLFNQRLLDTARERVGEGFDARHFTPNHKPWDQRVCVVPDGDLFQVIHEGRASIVTDTIKTFTPGGICLTGGGELPADIVVTATGLKLNVLGDMEFTVDGTPLDVPGTLVYKGMMLSGVPNFAYAFGYTNSSWTLKAELTADYVCRLLTHMNRRGFTSVAPMADPTAEARPLLEFNSGYVARAAATLPKQGTKQPWRVYQNYLLDKYTIQLTPLNDGTLVFMRPPTQARRGG